MSKENNGLNSKKYYSEEKKFEGHFQSQIFKTLLLVYQNHVRVLSVLFIVGFLGRIALLANANVIAVWVDSLCVISGSVCQPIPSFFKSYTTKDFLVLLSLLSCIGIGFIIIFRVSFSRISARAISVLYDEMTFRTSRYPLSFFDRTPVGRIFTRFSSDYGNVFRIFGGPLADFISVIFDLIAFFILVFLTSFYYIPFFLAVFLVNFYVYKKNKDGLRAQRRELSRQRSPSIAQFSESAQGAHVVRSFNKEKIFMKQFEGLDSIYMHQKYATIQKAFSYSLQVNIVFSFFYLLILIGSYFLLVKGVIGVGSLAVSLSFMVLASHSFQLFFDWMSQIEDAFTGVERLDEYLRKPIEENQKLPAGIAYQTNHPYYLKNEIQTIKNLSFVPEPTLEVKNIKFRYAEDLPFILNDISFKVNPKEKFGIVGKTGSGKSSLIQILFKLYPIYSGKILLNDQESTNYDLNFYRSHFSYIPQDPIVFMGTLEENLSLGRNVNADEMLEILRGVGLGLWFKKQKLGLKTKIEEKGKNLSMGERQLLCMARCILQNAPIVIMDEATSGVDPHTEEMLMWSMDRYLKDKTQIIIAHRLTTLEKCDRVLWIKKGIVHKVETPLAVFQALKNEEVESFF